MAPFVQLALSWLRFYGMSNPSGTQPTFGQASERRKSIAIVGAGTGGLSALKALLDLPTETRTNWDIVLYEKRSNVGGVWVLDTRNVTPPELPESPMYSLVRTNTPHPMMTFPHTNFIFPAETPILPSYESVKDYLQGFAVHYDLLRYMQFNHTVISASWSGDSSKGRWLLGVNGTDTGDVRQRAFDHLIVCAGHNYFPTPPNIPGLQDWLAGGRSGERVATHSMYYRDPKAYAGKNVIVVGGGASGRDMAGQISTYANITYHSVKPGAFVNVTIPGAVRKPQIANMSDSLITFADGSSVSEVNTVLLAIGYDMKIPFLTEGDTLAVIPPTSTGKRDDKHLTTNTRYIRPLYNHFLSLSSAYPIGSLYIIGLPELAFAASCGTVQSTFAAHTIANPTLLNIHNNTLLSPTQSRQEYLNALHRREHILRKGGRNPDWEGHRFSGYAQEAQDYEEDLIEWLKVRGVIGLPEGNYVEPWRRRARDHYFEIIGAWRKIETLGEDVKRRWLEGVETIEQWVGVMDRLAEWSKTEFGTAVVSEQDADF